MWQSARRAAAYVVLGLVALRAAFVLDTSGWNIEYPQRVMAKKHHLTR